MNYIIAQNISSHLSSRDIARVLFTSIVSEEGVVFDFDRVDFVSRSFADQYFEEKEKLSEQGISIREINRSKPVRQMFNRVSQQRKHGKPLQPKKTFKRLKDISDLDNLFIMG